MNLTDLAGGGGSFVLAAAILAVLLCGPFVASLRIHDQRRGMLCVTGGYTLILGLIAAFAAVEGIWPLLAALGATAALCAVGFGAWLVDGRVIEASR